MDNSAGIRLTNLVLHQAAELSQRTLDDTGAEELLRYEGDKDPLVAAKIAWLKELKVEYDLTVSQVLDAATLKELRNLAFPLALPTDRGREV